MRLRFQRRIKLLAGLHLNLSKSGIGISAGIPPLVLVLLFCSGPASATQITVDDSVGRNLKVNFQAVADDVWRIVRDTFHDATLPVDLPIFCQLGPLNPPLGSSKAPFTELDPWEHPTRIVIHLDVRDAYYAQFAFQLGHELGHVMLNPRRSNGVIDTICTALSYEVLDRMSDRWMMRVPFSYLRGYEMEFRGYRLRDGETRSNRLGQIKSDVRSGNWLEVRRFLYTHRSEQDQLKQVEIESEHGRDIQSLGAMALRSEAVQWLRFVGLAVCGQSREIRTQPRYQASELPKSCVVALSGALCRIGRGCPGMIP